MNAERGRRIAALFDRALDLDGTARARLLAVECADDPSLRAEVEALLAADGGDVAAALDEASTVSLGGLPQPGELVAGRYRIEARVGEGGMGVVFAAEQIEPRRRVALKVIRPGLLTADALQRFRREAAALGRLQHPGIAQVFEAGIADGEPPLPFLAMEFVDGIGLVEHAGKVSLPERLELLAAIAEAVAHAHERGVVHRDLKPANVLVEVRGDTVRPRVLDFGVARLDGEPLATVHTRTHQVIGTLAYMAPELLDQGSRGAGPRSDVWSLGVTAYELLAGVLPLPLAGRTLAEAARALRDEEPPRLDRRVPAIAFDVATVVHTAMAKDPARRYGNAGELAADLRRLLADEPIAARPPSVVYRAMRFTRRHRGPVFGAALALLALSIGLALSLRAANDAEQARQRAEARTGELRAMVRTLLTDVDRELQALPGASKARQQLLASGLQHAEAMAADAEALGGEAGAEVLVEVASFHLQLARLQGSAGGPSQGDVAGALSRSEQALAMVRRALALSLARTRPLQAQLDVLRFQESLVRALGRNDERERLLAAQEQVMVELERIAPGERTARLRTELTAGQARWLADRGKTAEALQGFLALVATLRTATAGDSGGSRSDREDLQTMLAQCLQLQRRLGDRQAATALVDELVQVASATHERHRDATSARGLATALRQQAMLAPSAAAALQAWQRARELLQPLAVADPIDADLQRDLSTTDYGIGLSTLQLGKYDEAVSLLQAHLANVQALIARFPGLPTLSRDLVPARQQLAVALARRGRFDEAEEVAATLKVAARAAFDRDPDSAQAGEDWLTATAAVAFVAEMRARNVPKDATPELRRQLRHAAADALAAQLQAATEQAERSRLAPSQRSMLTVLPPRIAELRGD